MTSSNTPASGQPRGRSPTTGRRRRDGSTVQASHRSAAPATERRIASSAPGHSPVEGVVFGRAATTGLLGFLGLRPCRPAQWLRRHFGLGLGSGKRRTGGQSRWRRRQRGERRQRGGHRVVLARWCGVLQLLGLLLFRMRLWRLPIWRPGRRHVRAARCAVRRGLFVLHGLLLRRRLRPVRGGSLQVRRPALQLGVGVLRGRVHRWRLRALGGWTARRLLQVRRSSLHWIVGVLRRGLRQRPLRLERRGRLQARRRLLQCRVGVLFRDLQRRRLRLRRRRLPGRWAAVQLPVAVLHRVLLRRRVRARRRHLLQARRRVLLEPDRVLHGWLLPGRLPGVARRRRVRRQRRVVLGRRRLLLGVLRVQQVLSGRRRSVQGARRFVQQRWAVLLPGVPGRQVPSRFRGRVLLPRRCPVRELEHLLLGEVSGWLLRRFGSAVQTERAELLRLEGVLLSELPDRSVRPVSAVRRSARIAPSARRSAAP